jgi:hypothetical protein
MTDQGNRSTARSERWMQTWPETMAKGPVRFIARYVAGMVACMTFGSLVVSLWGSEPLWRDASYFISQTAMQVMIGIAIGLSQWVHANRLYADKTGDPTARYWAQHPYEVSMGVWVCAVVALAAVITIFAGRMAWASGEPMLWAVALLCVAVGSVAVIAVSQMRGNTRNG